MQSLDVTVFVFSDCRTPDNWIGYERARDSNQTANGKSLLKGTVNSADAAATAHQVAQQTNGVKEVRSELTMAPAASQ